MCHTRSARISNFENFVYENKVRKGVHVLFLFRFSFWTTTITARYCQMSITTSNLSLLFKGQHFLLPWHKMETVEPTDRLHTREVISWKQCKWGNHFKLNGIKFFTLWLFYESTIARYKWLERCLISRSNIEKQFKIKGVFRSNVFHRLEKNRSPELKPFDKLGG